MNSDPYCFSCVVTKDNPVIDFHPASPAYDDYLLIEISIMLVIQSRIFGRKVIDLAESGISLRMIKNNVEKDLFPAKELQCFLPDDNLKIFVSGLKSRHTLFVNIRGANRYFVGEKIT